MSDKIMLGALATVVFGIILFLFAFLIVTVNPDVFIGDLGPVVILLGVLILAANAFRKRVTFRGVGLLLLVVVGWTTFAAGALTSFAGFILASQVVCMSPASYPYACLIPPLYNVMFNDGFAAAIAGLATVVGGSILSKRESHHPETLGPPRIRKKQIDKRVLAFLAIALTALTVFGLFSYWPGVYITSINESTQFNGGMPSFTYVQGQPPFMMSSTEQPASGFHLQIGGSFTYILHFSSVPSYPNYKIDTLSVNFGFSISSNVTLPLVISPANPSVSMVLDVNCPYYPYYGPVSFLLTIGNLNGTTP